MAAAGRVCASSTAGSFDARPGDLLGVDLLALGELLDAPIARYRVLDVVGGGGVGVVLAAFDERLQRRVAIKALRRRADPEHRGAEIDPAIRKEAQALAALSHPRVVEVFDVVEQGGRVFLVMELVAGTTLRTWQATRSRREIVRAYVAVADGLAAVHAAGLVHCDVKPDNVLVADDGRVLLADFGFAMLARPAAQRGELTGGTPRYMAPEQRRGEPLTPACDQYSLCVALWEALSGHVPPEGAGSIPAGLRRVIQRGLREDPSQRFPSAAALARALAPRRSAWIATLGTVAVLGAAGVAYGASGGQGEPVGGQGGASQASAQGATQTADAARGDRIVCDAIAKADALRREGKLIDAARTLDDVPRQDLPPDPLARLDLARIAALDRLGRVGDAIDVLAALEASTAQAPDELRARVALQVVRFGLGEAATSDRHQWLEMARAGLRRAQIDPDRDLGTRRAAAELGSIEGRHEDARAHYEAAVQHLVDADPPLLQVELWTAYASTLRRLGQHAEARAALQRADAVVDANELHGSDAALGLHISRANATAHGGDRGAAITMLQRAIADADAIDGVDPSVLGGALSDLGAYCLQENRLPEGFDALTRAEALMPRSYAVQSNLAMYWSKIPCQDAVGAAEVARCTKDALDRGHQHQVRAFERARQDLGADHPSLAQMSGNLMHSYLQRGELAQAKKYAAAAITGLRKTYGEEHARLIAPLLSTIELYVRTGDPGSAMRSADMLEGAAAANAESLGDAAKLVVQYVLGRTRIWAEQARPDDAARVRDALAALGPSPPDDVRLIDSWFTGTDPLAVEP